MHIVYAIFNKKYRKLYIGQTEDLPDRLDAHRDKRFRSSYTARFDGNWILIYSERVASRHEALKREKELKSYRGREFVKRFIPE